MSTICVYVTWHFVFVLFHVIFVDFIHLCSCSACFVFSLNSVAIDHDPYDFLCQNSKVLIHTSCTFIMSKA